MINIAWRMAGTLSVAVLFLFGCAKCSNDVSTDKGEVVAYVNNDAIYKSDLKRDMALSARTDPSIKLTPEAEAELLDAIIDRKIMVQYAMEKGLAREESFVAAIRSIWEHTLIRDLFEYKQRQFKDYVFVTDDDINKYYDNMSYRATFNIFKTRDKKASEEAYDRCVKDNNLSGWELLGPLGYDEINSSALQDAFSMAEGDTGKFVDGSTYYVIRIAKKDKAEVEPLSSELKADIGRRVAAYKEKRLFEDWLKERRKKCRIRIKTGQI